MNYPVVIHKDADSDYGVTVPDLPGCFPRPERWTMLLPMLWRPLPLMSKGCFSMGSPFPSRTRSSLIGTILTMATAYGPVVTVDLSRVSGKAQRINVTIPERILSRVDDYAKETGDSRSGLMAAALLEYISQRPEKEVI